MSRVTGLSRLGRSASGGGSARGVGPADGGGAGGRAEVGASVMAAGALGVARVVAALTR